jgi:hypothetical protein
MGSVNGPRTEIASLRTFSVHAGSSDNGAFEAAGNAQYSLERAHERAERITKRNRGLA